VFFDLRNLFLTHRKDFVKKWKKFPDLKNNNSFAIFVQ